MDAVFGAFAFYLPNDGLWHVAFYCALAGVCGGWLAMITGLLDLFQRILKHGTKATNQGWIHGGIQSSVITGFTILALIEYKNQDFITSPPSWLWGTKLFLLAAMVLGNYLGGELLMKYVAKDFQSDTTTR
jgi:uncharacterized membrane protein